MSLSSSLLELAERYAPTESLWGQMHDRAQALDVRNGTGVLSGCDMRCFRNHLVECFPEDEEEIRTLPEGPLLRHCFLKHPDVMEHYDWSDPELTQLIEAFYGRY
jgi:hypothetical protein